MQKKIADKNVEGKKLTTFLTSMYPELNINTVYKALRKKDIKVNGTRINSDIIIEKNDVIEIYISDDLLLGKKNIEIPIVYEDDNIVVFNKPINVEVQGKNSLAELMKEKYNYIEPCHRIDRNTSGIVVFAKNEESLKIIQEQFKKNKVEKHYIACCYGIAKNKECLEAYLFKDRKKSMVYISDSLKKGYVKIKTSYNLIDINKENKLSLLDITLHTGKTHQIRAHLAHIGLPIVGDGKYGSYKINHLYKRNKQALASYSITFNDIQDNKLKYLNNKVFKLAEIPFYDLLNFRS